MAGVTGVRIFAGRDYASDPVLALLFEEVLAAASLNEDEDNLQVEGQCTMHLLACLWCSAYQQPEGPVQPIKYTWHSMNQHPLTHLPACLPVYLPICLPIYLSIYV